MARGLTDAQIVERLERLERSVAAIAKKTGVEIEDPSEGVDPEVVKLARAGKEMDAAKLYSERTGADFVEAQRIVAGL
jgi:uncharacterized protein (UPF0335 family)